MATKQVNSVSDFAIPNGDTPVLPKWWTDPDSSQAAEDRVRDTVAWFIAQYMRELALSHEEAEALPDHERTRLIAEGVNRAIPVLSSNKNATDRATSKLAYMAFKASLHAFDKNEPDSFEVYLAQKLLQTESKGRISELMFMFEVLQSYEKRGEKEWVEGLFADRQGFSKFLKNTKELRQTRDQIVAAEIHFQMASNELDKQIRTANGPERDALIDQQRTVARQQQETLGTLQANLGAKLDAAVRMSKDPNIDVEYMTQIITTVTAENPDGTSVRPNKLPVEKMILKGGALAYLIVITPEGERMVERAIRDFAEVYVTSPAVALAKFKPYM